MEASAALEEREEVLRPAAATSITEVRRRAVVAMEEVAVPVALFKLEMLQRRRSQ